MQSSENSTKRVAEIAFPTMGHYLVALERHLKLHKFGDRELHSFRFSNKKQLEALKKRKAIVLARLDENLGRVLAYSKLDRVNDTEKIILRSIWVSTLQARETIADQLERAEYLYTVLADNNPEEDKGDEDEQSELPF